MENSIVKKEICKNVKTMADLEAILSHSTNLLDAALDKKTLYIILQGFLVSVEHFQSTSIDDDDIKTAIKWVELFVQIQHSKYYNPAESLLLSKNMPTFLTYMIGLVDLMPKDQSSALKMLLRLMQRSIQLTDAVCFERFTRHTGHIAILWSALERVTSFEIQAEILRLITHIMHRLDANFVLSEVQSQSKCFDDIKTKLLALKDTNDANDDQIYALTRHILNVLNSKLRFEALVHSFYCENLTFGEEFRFERPNHSPLFWFNINSYPRTLTFDGIIDHTVEKSEPQNVHISLRIKRFSRQENKLKIFFKPPATMPFDLTNELSTIDYVVAILSESEMKRFSKIFNVDIEEAPALPQLEEVDVTQKAINAANDLKQKMDYMESFNLSQTAQQSVAENAVEQVAEFKMPSIELYQKALSKKNKKKLPLPQERRQNYKEIATTSKRQQLANQKGLKPLPKEHLQRPSQQKATASTALKSNQSLSRKRQHKNEVVNDSGGQQQKLASTKKRKQAQITESMTSLYNNHGSQVLADKQNIMKDTTLKPSSQYGTPMPLPATYSSYDYGQALSKDQLHLDNITFKSTHQQQPTNMPIVSPEMEKQEDTLLLSTASLNTFYKQPLKFDTSPKSKHVKQLFPVEEHQAAVVEAEATPNEAKQTQVLASFLHYAYPNSPPEQQEEQMDLEPTASTVTFYGQTSKEILDTNNNCEKQPYPEEAATAENITAKAQQIQENVYQKHNDHKFNVLTITPTQPTTKNRFFKTSREPRTYSMIYKDAVIKAPPKFTNQRPKKNVLLVPPLKVYADLCEEDVPKVADAANKLNTTAHDGNFEAKRKAASLPVVDMTTPFTFTEAPALADFSASYLDEPCTSKQAKERAAKYAQISNKQRTIITTQQSPFVSVFQNKAQQQQMTDTQMDNSIVVLSDSSSEFSDSPESLPLDAVLSKLESPPTTKAIKRQNYVEYEHILIYHKRSDSEPENSPAKKNVSNAARRRRFPRQTYAESSSDSDYDMEPLKKRLRKSSKTKKG